MRQPTTFAQSGPSLKITHFSKYFYPFRGGIEDHVHDVAKYQALTHNVTVVCYNHKRSRRVVREEIDGIYVIRLPLNCKIRSQPVSFDINSANDALLADVVHFHAPNVQIQEYLYRRRKQINRLIITHHADIVKQYILRVLFIARYKELQKFADRIIVTSESLRRSSRDLYSHSKTEIVNLSASSTSAVEVEGEISSAYVAPYVCMVGRLTRYKGVDVAIRAMSYVNGLKLYVAGDGEERTRLDDLVRRLGLSSRVILLGNVSDAEKVRLMKGARCLLLPSINRAEALGMVLLEAANAGVPIIASQLGTGVNEVAINGQTALTTPPGDPRSLAEAIKLMTGDDHLRARLSAQARQHVMTHFSQSVMNGRIDAIINSLL